MIFDHCCGPGKDPQVVKTRLDWTLAQKQVEEDWVKSSILTCTIRYNGDTLGTKTGYFSLTNVVWIF